MSDLILFQDIETTGVNEPEERIIEFCGMLFDLATEQHVETLTLRCNPMRKINAKAQKVHGISNADLEKEPLFDVIAPAIVDIIGRASINVAHNGDEFDFPFIKRECMRVGHYFTYGRTYDTMKQARWATAYGKNPRLGELAECLDVPYDPSQAHSAEYDVEVMAKCFFEGRRIGWYVI